MGLAGSSAEAGHPSATTPTSTGPAVLLISAFDVGHQPFGLASPAAWLVAAGARVSCLDLAVQALDDDAVRAADPLKRIGVNSVIGGEFEAPLADLARGLHGSSIGLTTSRPPVISLARQGLLVPDRRGLPGLSHYAYLTMPDGVRVGAQHITFGDPDFFNGPAHAIALTAALHSEFPELTYDVVIKVEHLVKRSDRLQTLKETGCVLITTAVESFDERLLEIFDKRHTRAEFIAAVQILRELGIALNPTFVAFTPWTTMDGYVDFLCQIDEFGLVDNVTPIQYAIRLLIPDGSKLLELSEVTTLVQSFDPVSLVYPPPVNGSRADIVRKPSPGGITPWITPTQRSNFPHCYPCNTRRSPLPSWKTHPTVSPRRAHRSHPRVPSGARRNTAPSTPLPTSTSTARSGQW
jgi:hypothetical protein